MGQMLSQEVKILIVEDDKELSDQIAELLLKQDYKVEQCFDGEAGLVKASTQQHQLILLDVMLPKRDGISMLKMLRKTCQTPVIMVTAKGAEQEKIEGFSLGADDYVAKPFNQTELVYRIEALLRRSLPNDHEGVKELAIDNMRLDAHRYGVYVDEKCLEFTPVQFKLLWELLLHRGEVLSKAYLYQRVLNRNIGAYDRSIDMHLSRVRRKLNEVDGPGYRLKTSHGQGYSLV